MAPEFDLDRFVEAQERDRAYETAVAELRAGRKRSHWIWFVFPQIVGLGSSSMSQHYAISGRAEAAAYLAHPLLRSRLQQCAEALLALPTRDPSAVLGEVDAMKLRSSMTLFAGIPDADPVFNGVMEEFFGGRRDDATERLLA